MDVWAKSQEVTDSAEGTMTPTSYPLKEQYMYIFLLLRETSEKRRHSSVLAAQNDKWKRILEWNKKHGWNTCVIITVLVLYIFTGSSLP